MKALLLCVSLTMAALPLESAQARCLCNAINLNRCEGTGPTLLRTFLWSDAETKSQWWDLTYGYAAEGRDECRALSSVPVPSTVPVFNYYGNLVHGCEVTWFNCDLR